MNEVLYEILDTILPKWSNEIFRMVSSPDT